jgi:hypothetical protein
VDKTGPSGKAGAHLRGGPFGAVGLEHPNQLQNAELAWTDVIWQENGQNTQ